MNSVGMMKIIMGTVRVAGSRAALDLIGAHPRLTASALRTVGSKGYDGFAIAVVG